MASWPSGKAQVCNTFIAGSNPADAFSKKRTNASFFLYENIVKLWCDGRNDLIESTLSGTYLTKMMDDFHKEGYDVTLVYVFLYSPEVCIERIKERVLKGGHFVPDRDVIRRYYRSKENFWNNYKNEADKWFLVYNSENKFIPIALGMKNQFSIENKDYFYKFMSKFWFVKQRKNLLFNWKSDHFSVHLITYQQSVFFEKK